MHIAEHVLLNQYCTMKIGGSAKYFVKVVSKSQLKEAVAFAKEQKLPILPLGDGSNTIFTDKGFDGLIIKILIPGIKVNTLSTNEVEITAGGGINWDELVKKSVEMGLTGIESLSAIPGTVGAAPVQNIGAYGQELADTFVSLTAYDLKKDQFVTLTKNDCDFSYRNSIFKTTQKNRYVITEVTLRLRQGQIKPPLYTTLQKYMKENNLTDLSPVTIHQAVSQWRSVYLPSPKVVPNAGSFFGNPIISKQQLQDIKNKNPKIAQWPTQWYWELPSGQIKIAAGRLAEAAGLKDWHDEQTGMATWKNQALVLVNENAKSYTDLERFKQKYLNKIKTEYGIVLEQEPSTIIT
jgi:UDP-N-acetylmuramate dehydrogenase